ncbi:MAG: DUF4832 domain-containing protein [Clostridia bacterium]|nr:DUF4832 domain-containing protein [Clostridia bacterium]
MKKSKLKVIISITCVVILIFSSVIGIVLNSLSKRVRDYTQNLSYAEITTDILNPDQGFYKTATIKVSPESVEDRSYIISKDYQIYHLRFDLSEFSSAFNEKEDLQLTIQALTQIDTLINKFFKAGKNLVVRFSYDKNFDGNKNQEPSEDMILKHITQLCSILNKYPITITAIEAGMVGPWGEMHSSTLATPETISKIIDKFLTNTQNIPILVRTPKMIYDYLGITIDDIDTYKIDKNSKAYRLGIFNDGYLGSDSDLGTYTDREKETTWLSNQTNHLPFGGEVTGEKSTLHDINKCLPEMFKMNLSYLNYEWNDKIVQEKWQEQKYDNTCGTDLNYYGQSAYHYIKEHLGYRLVLKKSIFSYSSLFNNLKVKLSIENVGFGEFNKTKNLIVYFIKDGKIEKSIPIQKYSGESEIEFNIDITSFKGDYLVYLGIVSTQNGQICYPVRFANNLWSETLSANLIGGIAIR